MAESRKAQIAAEYRKARAWQMKTYGLDGLHIDGRSARQFTGGSAAYGEHALQAFNSAKRHIHFCIALGRMIDGHQQRSK